MRRLLLSAITTLCLLPACVSAALIERPINSIAAIVNGHIILQSAVNEQVANLKQQASSAKMAPISADDLNHLVTNQLVMQTLQLQIAANHHIHVTKTQLNNAIASIAKTNHVSIDGLKEKLHKEGHDFKRFKQQLSDQLTIMSLQHQVISGENLQITDADVKAYRAKNNLPQSKYLYQVGDILINTPDQMTAEQAKNLKRRADGIAKRIAHGDDFKKIAQLESSADSPHANHVLDWSRQDELPTAFEHAFKTYQVGESKGPIRTANGWHIIKILNKKTNTKGMSDEQIKELLYRQQYNAIIEKWLKDLRHSSDIHILNASS